MPVFCINPFIRLEKLLPLTTFRRKGMAGAKILSINIFQNWNENRRDVVNQPMSPSGWP